MAPLNDPSTDNNFIAGYQQVYVVKRKTVNAPEHNEVFFQCGEWCYDGFVKLDFEGRDLTVQEVSNIPRELHRHQDDLSFLCLSENVLSESKSFAPSLKIIEDANNFIVDELSSPGIMEEVQRIGKDKSFDSTQFDEGHFFELVANIPSEMKEIECICCKTYVKEALICVVFFEGIFYCVLQHANEDQPLLDISFPDIMREGNGATLAIYDSREEENDSDTISWVKLSLWQSVPVESQVFKNAPASSTVSLATNTYGQSYCILKPNKADRSNRDVLFRFGSWCYSGRAELIDTLCIEDIPLVIPALRAQQNKLAFLCHSSEMLTDNIFTAPLAHISEITNLMEREVIASEGALVALQKQSMLDLDEDPKHMFFQFETVANNVLQKSHIDCIATKTYRPNGLVVMSIFFRGTFYVCLSPGEENQPLLDSAFPCIVQGKGYQIKQYPSGLSEWPELRKLSLWRNAESLTSKEELEVKSERNDNKQEIDMDDKKHDLSDSKSVHVPLDEKERDEKPIRRSEPNQKPSTMNVAEPKSSDNKNSNPLSKGEKVTRPSCRRKTSNLGAFHHLAPLKKPSKLEEHMKASKRNDISGNNPQWHSDGRPIKT
jgi:hypothetical protein